MGIRGGSGELVWVLVAAWGGGGEEGYLGG